MLVVNDYTITVGELIRRIECALEAIRQWSHGGYKVGSCGGEDATEVGKA
jgi:hypothetical protein